MHPLRLSNRLRRRGLPSGGFALIAVLAMIVLLCAVLAAFISKSRSAAQASANFTNAAAVNALGRDAINNIILGLQQEIDAGSENLGSKDHPFYIAKNWYSDAATDVLPQLDEAAKTASEAGAVSLLKSSGSQGPVFANDPASLASSVGTDVPALEGRVLSAARWNSAALLTAAQNNALPAPKWVYNNRRGPVAVTGTTVPAAARQAISNGQINPEFIIGRYAYRVYDLSGLVDINVAGFPQSARDTARAARKGSLATLDFINADFPGFAPATSESFLDWRGPTGDLAGYIHEFGRKYGFLRTPASSSGRGVNRLLSRGDLIQLTSAKSFAGDFTNRSDFLQQATVFSREVNGPIYAPVSGPTASPTAMNAPIGSVPVAKEFVRHNGQTARIGEPLAKYRFPLSRIDLLAVESPSEEVKARIEAYFGLVARDDGKWDYVHGTREDTFADATTGKRERLRTLSEIAELGREPNFFELLQTAIHADSLGQGARDEFFTNSWPDQNIARHVLSIGVNIIDQYDEDDDPTVIARTPLEQLNQYDLTPDADIAGIENLPYFHLIGRHVFRRQDRTELGSAGINYPYVTSYYQFQLWNPHRNADSAPESDFRIVASGDLRLTIRNVDNQAVFLHGAPVSYNPADSIIAFQTSSDDKGLKFTEPMLLKPGMAGLSVTHPDQNIYQISGTRANVVGFWQGDVYAPYDGFTDTAEDTPPEQRSHNERFGVLTNNAGSYNGDAPTARSNFVTSAYPEILDTGLTHGVSFQLQKKDRQGNWRPVQTVPAVVLSASTPMADVLSGSGENGTQRLHDYFNEIDKHSMLGDPRTVRFGFFRANGANKRGIVNAPFKNNGTWIFGGWLPSNPGRVSASSTTTADVRLLRVNENLKTSDMFYRDRGTTPVLRTTDLPAKSPFIDVTGRPILLNRSFTSLAELGYAFRDLPWKSLNLSQDVEASDAPQTPADAALLDLFTLSEAPVRAGVVNLNTASEETLTTLLRGVDLQPVNGSDAKLTAAEASQFAQAARTYLGPRHAPVQVIRTAADIPAMIQQVSKSAGLNWSKHKREAVIAALADVHNSRTWNLLVDVFVQTGRFPIHGTGGPNEFSITGQKHLLVHLAIDRSTGEVVDQLVEEPSEF